MCVGYSPLPRSSNTPLQDLSSRHYSTRIHPMILPVTWKINLNWMIPNLYMGNGCLTKHPFKFGCLEFQVLLLCQNHRENAGTLGWYPSCLSLLRSPLKGNVPNKYPLYKVHMGLIIKGPPSQGYHHFPYDKKHLLLLEWTSQSPGSEWFSRIFFVGVFVKAEIKKKQFRVGDSSWDSSLKPCILGTWNSWWVLKSTA